VLLGQVHLHNQSPADAPQAAGYFCASTSEHDLRPNRRRRGAEKLKIAAPALKLLKSFGFWFTLERGGFSSNRHPLYLFV
jgi:hypothetical protein